MKHPTCTGGAVEDCCMLSGRDSGWCRGCRARFNLSHEHDWHYQGRPQRRWVPDQLGFDEWDLVECDSCGATEIWESFNQYIWVGDRLIPRDDA